jgi:hypothetical protein
MTRRMGISRPKSLRDKGPARVSVAGQEGMVLISSLLILASVSLIAFGLAGDSTTELRIANNRRLDEQTFTVSDGGANIGVQVILDHLYEAVDPSTDYPGDGEIPLMSGSLYLRHFAIDTNLLADIKGYPGNDNADDPYPVTYSYPPSYVHPPDVSFELASEAGAAKPDSAVMVDIDRLQAKLMAGSSIEFAAGYEGVGKGASTGSVAIFYAIDSIAFKETARSEVTCVYRKVSNVTGGAQ